MSSSSLIAGWRPLATAAVLALSVLTPAAAAAPAQGAENGDSVRAVRHRSVRVQGLDIFYREAGPARGPVVLLLHGFPSSSFMFRELIPKLADRYRVIAPDFPGFGQSSFPARGAFPYTFERLASVMAGFTDALGLSRYALYVQDYGAPIGLRLALARPERVAALVVQNGNAYEEGLSQEAWAPLRRYWREPTAAHREALKQWLTPEGVRLQYTAGVPAPIAERLSPDTWTLDWARLSRPGNLEAQLDLFGDYQSNVALYPRFHELFRARRFPTLIVWGEHDIFFTRAGAEAYKRDLPDAELVFLDTGHFALETHAEEIAHRMRAFLARVEAERR